MCFLFPPLSLSYPHTHKYIRPHPYTHISTHTQTHIHIHTSLDGLNGLKESHFTGKNARGPLRQCFSNYRFAINFICPHEHLLKNEKEWNGMEWITLGRVVKTSLTWESWHHRKSRGRGSCVCMCANIKTIKPLIKSSYIWSCGIE